MNEFENPFLLRMQPEERRDELVREFLEERCEVAPLGDDQKLHGKARGTWTPIRKLGQEWDGWLLVEGCPPDWRRVFNAQWLKERLTDPNGAFGYREAHYDGLVVIVGIKIADDVAPFAGTPGKHTWDDLANMPPDLAYKIPLRGASEHCRPSSDEIMRRFLLACCTIIPRPEQARGESWYHVLRRWEKDSFLRLARAFQVWLKNEGATPSLRTYCNSRWFKQQIRNHRGSNPQTVDGKALAFHFVTVHDGYLAVYGLKLNEGVESSVVLRKKTLADGRTILVPDAGTRAARREAFENRMEQRAHIEAGRDPSVPLSPESQSVVQSRAKFDTERREERSERRMTLGQHARAYVAYALRRTTDDGQPDDSTESALPLHLVTAGFLAYLRNRQAPMWGAPGALRGALAERGHTFPKGKKGQLVLLHGERFSTPADDAPEAPESTKPIVQDVVHSTR